MSDWQQIDDGVWGDSETEARLSLRPGLSLDDYLAQRNRPKPADVITERERRLALGFDYDFGDAHGLHRIGTTAQDMAGWREVTDLANAYIASSISAGIYIVTDTGPVTVTPAEWTQILLAAAAFRQPLWGASFILQSMDPIPADFAADGYWQAP